MSAKKGRAAETPSGAPPPMRNRFPGSYLPDRSPKSISGQDAITLLEKAVAPLPDGLASLLNMPENVFFSASFLDYLSVSSDSGLDGKAVAASLLTGQPFPEKIPDYAIYITHLGSTRFCVFLERKRQIIAYAPLSNIMVEGAGWGALQNRIEEAIRASDANRSKNMQFKFVVRGERHPDAVF